MINILYGTYVCEMGCVHVGGALRTCVLRSGLAEASYRPKDDEGSARELSAVKHMGAETLR